MKTLVCILTFVVIIHSSNAQKAPDPTFQIKTAVLAAPKDLREGATVLGYDESGTVTTLRKGNNQLICLADDPAKEGFSVAAYHKDLEPFMSRGRALKAEGMNPKEVFDQREKEVKEGKLNMPDKAILYVTTGTIDESGEPTDLYTRYVVYIPYATSESTGMPLGPIGPGSPWIMDPGTHRAHIMISPPKN